MTQKFKCPQKTHKFLRIERNRIENTEISIFYILYSIFYIDVILYSIFYILYSVFCILYSVFLK